MSPAVPAAGERRTALARRAAAAGERWTPFHAALALMMLTFVWRLQDLFPLLGKFKITPLATAAAITLFLMTGVERVPERLRHPVFRIALVILVLAVLSVPDGVWPGYSFRFILDDHVKTVLFAVMLGAAVRSARDVDRFVAVHVAGATLYSLVILRRFEVQPDGRLGGLIYYDANDLAMLLVCTLPLLVYLTRPGAPTWMRVAALPVFSIFLLLIVQTGSRGGFLGLIAVLAVLMLRFTALPGAHRFGAVAAVAVALTVAGNAQFWERLSTLLNPKEDYNWSGNSAGGRMDVWTRGIGYMMSHPVNGVGASAFGVAEGSISPMAAAYETTGQGFKWSAAHNSFVQIGAELGFPGLIAFLLLLHAAFRVTLRVAREGRRGARGPPSASVALAQALTATMAGFVVCGFFLSQAYSAYLYSMLALIVGLDQVSRHAPASAAAAAPEPVLPRRPLGRGGLIVGARN